MKEHGFHCGWRDIACAIVLLAMGAFMASAVRADAQGSQSAPNNTPIRHIIIIFQENRSLDSYFGTYPGADGIPMRNGVPTVCVPDPETGKCVKPYHTHDDVTCGGPHEAEASLGAVANGKMNGFIAEVETVGNFGLYPMAWARQYCQDPKDPKEADQVM
ncbi:MAG: hypothetical protein KGL37_08890, partial [Acidobacteriota bacterium]|nr:hypothetical protein [Acidobacteriota bacterium]